MPFTNINRETATGGVGNNDIYSKVNTSRNTVTATNTEGSSLQELQPGRVFAGEIVSVGKEKVTLKLDGGQLIQALSNSDVQLREGQLLAFMVKSNTGKQLAIKPMFDVMLQSPSVLKALENAGIPVSAKSAELINTLMQEQMPIDRDTVNRFLRQMNLNPQVQIKLLVDLQKMGQTVNGENIAKFQGYQNHQYPLAADVANLASDISESIAAGAAGEDSIGVQTFLQTVDIFLPETEEIMKGEALNSKTASTVQNNRTQFEVVDNMALNSNTASKAVNNQTMSVGVDDEALNPQIASKAANNQILSAGMDDVMLNSRIASKAANNQILSAGMDDVMLNSKTVSTVSDNQMFLPETDEVMWNPKLASIVLESNEVVNEDELGKVKEMPGNLQNLSGAQSEELNTISGVAERFQGQNMAMESVLEGLKVLHEEASRLLEELQSAIVTEAPKPEQNDMITRLYAAFESYERSEKAIQQAKDAVATKHDILTQNQGKQQESEMFSRDTLAGILEESQRNVLAQKIYKITGNIRQYFEVRTGEMQPEDLVRMIRGQLPKDELLAELRNSKTERLQQTGIVENGEIPKQNGSVKEEALSATQLKNLILTGNIGEKGNLGAGQPDTNVQGQNFSDNTKQEQYTWEKDNQIQINQEKNPDNRQEDAGKNQFQQEVVQKQLEKLPKVKELLQSSEFKTVLRATIENQMLLKPEELTRERVRDYYEKIQQQLNKLTELAEQTQSQDNPVLKNTNVIRQNVEYINQLNQLYSYVQLPLKLTNQNTNSELYVLTNKRHMRDDSKSFTALLHLDMERLGDMDVYITMEEKKVATRFYLEHEGIAMFLKENSQPLLKKLEEKGFHITAEFTKKPEGRNLVEEFTDGNAKETLESKHSFDIRM